MTEHDTVLAQEKEHTMNLSIKEVLPMGYGNPAAKISHEKQVESGALSPEVAARSKELIMSGECMRDVTDDDDGCGDGRHATEVLCVSEAGEFYTAPVENSADHIRETVFGAGYITGYAMLRGTGQQGNSIDEDISRVGELTGKASLHCGAHTGAHAHEGETTDCGANDRIREIIESGVAFRSDIMKDTKALLEAGGIAFDETVFNRVIDNWSTSLTDDTYFGDSNGSTRFNRIQDNIAKAQAKDGQGNKAVAVSKDLAGNHREAYTVISYVEGKHFSQADFAAKLSESFPDLTEETRPQAFTVDVPRIIKLAKAIADGDETRFNEALYAGVAFQLATAVVLTDGSLPTFLVHEQ